MGEDAEIQLSSQNTTTKGIHGFPIANDRQQNVSTEEAAVALYLVRLHGTIPKLPVSIDHHCIDTSYTDKPVALNVTSYI